MEMTYNLDELYYCGMRLTCHLCGDNATDGYVARWNGWNGPDFCRLVACQECIEAGAEQIDQRIEDFASALEARAKKVRGYIGQVKLPSHAELQSFIAAENSAEEQRLRESEIMQPNDPPHQARTGE
jgi:hypothetical protein